MEKHQFHRRHAVSRWSKLVWILEASGFGDPNLKILLKRDQQKLNMQILDPKNRDLEHDLFSFSQKGRLDVFVGSSSGWFSNVFFFGFRIENIGTTYAATKHPNINELYNRGSVTFRRFFLPHDDCLLLWKVQTPKNSPRTLQMEGFEPYIGRFFFGGVLKIATISAVRCDWIDPWHRGKGLVEWSHVWRLLHTHNILHLDHNTTECHGNPQPSFLGVITHILGV